MEGKKSGLSPMNLEICKDFIMVYYCRTSLLKTLKLPFMIVWKTVIYSLVSSMSDID